MPVQSIATPYEKTKTFGKAIHLYRSGSSPFAPRVLFSYPTGGRTTNCILGAQLRTFIWELTLANFQEKKHYICHPAGVDKQPISQIQSL
jgi:hypothetical protein